ncbi:hypothetical protein FO488_00290 [Geobacter sp. FeAm09]|uniref:hypothetical protein n=1 Tax=Geobacter sp. FeAm09 TaxID=2597769 RepID=UPI0011F08BD0|nr:hypothetical protein [Geobacter sp. FeAm09]QEM66745.1 hypothetical protein FO488_00290 [Geobacter sp. FeAm09]
MDPLDYFGLPSAPPFAHKHLLSWHDLNFHELEPYVIQEQSHGCASVNVFKVVGTRHTDYAGGTWLNLLHNGRRMMSNLPMFRNNPGYYLATGPKEPYMHYVSIDGGDIYIGAEGNHRTCIAQFHFFTQGLTTLHGIRMDDYRIDWAFKAACDELRTTAESIGQPLHISVVRKMIDRNDAADWRQDSFTLTAKVIDSKSRTFELNHEDLQSYTRDLKRPWWKIWAGFPKRRKQCDA